VPLVPIQRLHRPEQARTEVSGTPQAMEDEAGDGNIHCQRRWLQKNWRDSKQWHGRQIAGDTTMANCSVVRVFMGNT